MGKNTHIERAVAILGSQTALAAAIGCSQQQISYMIRAERVTAEMAVAIDKATNGQVSRTVLRPDIFQHEMARGAEVPARQGNLSKNAGAA